jgi:hypothetical protein
VHWRPWWWGSCSISGEACGGDLEGSRAGWSYLEDGVRAGRLFVAECRLDAAEALPCGLVCVARCGGSVASAGDRGTVDVHTAALDLHGLAGEAAQQSRLRPRGDRAGRGRGCRLPAARRVARWWSLAAVGWVGAAAPACAGADGQREHWRCQGAEGERANSHLGPLSPPGVVAMHACRRQRAAQPATLNSTPLGSDGRDCWPQAKPTARPLAPLWRLELVMGERQRTLWRRWTSEGGASRLAPPPVWVLRRGAAAWAHAPDKRGRTEDERGEQARLGDRGETPAVGVVIG